MDNEFGYIDDKPFEECYKDKQIMSLINTDEKGIEFKVTGNNKFSIFDIGNSLKEIYAIDSKFCPITAFRVNIINSKLTAISSSTLRSDLYFYKQGFQEENRKIKHFTRQTKIYKIEYYNDSISRVFGNSSFDIDLKRVQKNDKYVLKTVNIKADKKKEQKICNINIVDNNISVFLKENFEYLHNYRNSERISINDNSCIIVKFQKGINFTNKTCNSFFNGFEIINAPKKILAALIASFGIWFFECLNFYITIQGFGYNLHWSVTIFIICFIALACMIPSTSIFGKS